MKKILIIAAAVFLLAAAVVSAQDAEADTAEEIFDEATLLIDQEPAAVQPADDGQNRFFTTWDFIKVILILIAIILVVYGVFFALKKAGGSKYQSDDLIRLLGSQSLTQNGSVHLIEVGSKYYLVGCAEGSVNHIADIDDKETVDEIILKNPPKSENKKTFADFFNFRIGRNEPSEKDLKGKIHNNSKFVQDQAERLKKL